MEATDSDGAAHSPPHPSMNTSTPRDRLWRKRLNELSAVWPDFVSGQTAGLHKTRVASRRIREALPIVGGVGVAREGQEAQQENARADAIARPDPRARRRARPAGRQVEDRRRPGPRDRNGAARSGGAASGAAPGARGQRAGHGFEKAAQEAGAGRDDRQDREDEEDRGEGRGQREEGQRQKAESRVQRARSRRSGAACSRHG